MKNFLILLVALCCSTGHASENDLLERAVGCDLRDEEVASLVKTLKATHPDFKKSSLQYALPTADVYQLANPLRAIGYASNQVVITPARILMVLPNETISSVVQALGLKEMPFSPMRREIRPTVSIVAFHLSHKALAGKLLLGCEYANSNSASWFQEEKW
ncbi:MAG TPA: hypothetical protein VEC35_08735 [Noviherbaspirillum sp.]|nr:hypothetical protein [Noviherbaspirillum sp.]